jgi:acetyl esterase/lipase
MTKSIWLAAVVVAALAVGEQAHAQTVGETVARRAAVGAEVTPVGMDSFANVRVPMAGGVVGLPDVTYSALTGYRPLKLDLFLPPPKFNAAGPRPLVVYIHGGGWVMGGPRRSAAYLDWPAVLGSLAEQGYVVAAVSYRFAAEARFPAQIQDVKSAIRWLRVNAERYHIDRNSAVVWGQSAGGHLAGLAATSCNVAALAPAPRKSAPERPVAETQASAPERFDEASDCVQGAVVWFGVFDVTPAPGRPTTGPLNLLLGCDNGPCPAQKLRAASPISYVGRNTPPILVMHGANDATVPIAQSQMFYRALQANGVPSSFVVEPAVGHSWLGSPAATRAASYDALKRSVDFIEATIGDRRSRGGAPRP